MKTFVLTKTYGESAGISCGQARASEWRKQKSGRCRPIHHTLPPLIQQTHCTAEEGRDPQRRRRDCDGEDSGSETDDGQSECGQSTDSDEAI